LNKEQQVADSHIDVLEKLIETCRDGQNGYRDAAEHIKDPQIRAWFNEQSLERARFAGELENYVQRLGKSDPDRKGSVSGALHRRWFDLKEKFAGSDHSVLEEVERGEDNAKHNYQDALNQNLPADVRDVVQQQAQSVFAAHDRAKALRDQLKRAA
jgi:uncharacterized protein (TIGR02284 family)